MTFEVLSTPLAGCELRPLTPEACQQFLHWLLNNGSPPQDTLSQLELGWALAHCDDGVTWGRWDSRANRWQLGCAFDAELSPSIILDRLQELRLFGPGGEVLLWRCEAGLQGRLLRDAPAAGSADPENSPLRPWDQERIVRGNGVKQSYGNFTHVADRGGAEQLLPLAVTKEQLTGGKLRLVVRHYFQQDETGAVRIAASRLVELRV